MTQKKKQSLTKSDFKKVQNYWYQKLEETGFKDIEYADGSILSCLPRTAGTKDELTREATKEYYYLCYHFLHEYKFASTLEKAMWEYHANGISVRSIAELVNQFLPDPISKNTVWRVVSRLEKTMKDMYLSK